MANNKSLFDLVSELQDAGLSDEQIESSFGKGVGVDVGGIKSKTDKMLERIQSPSGAFEPEYGGPVTQAELEAVTPEELNQAKKQYSSWKKYEDINTPKSTYDTASKYGVSPSKVQKDIVKSNVATDSPLDVKDFEKFKSAKLLKDQKLNLLKNIAGQAIRYGGGALGTGLSAKDLYEDIKEDKYPEAAIDATGVLSGLAGMAGRSIAYPLAIPSLAKGVASVADEYAWNRIPESTQKGGVSSLDTALSKAKEDTPEGLKLRKVLKNKFDLDISPNGKKLSSSDIENLSNPEMVEKEEENKAYQDALTTSKVTKPNLTEGQHEENALRAVRQLREKRALAAEGKTPVTALGDFLSGLFEESPESAKNRREIARKQFDRANEVRRSMGLPEKPMPKEYMEEVPYVKKEEDEKPYEFKSKQLGETPARSSGLKEGQQDFKDFLTKAQVKYPESASKGQDYVKDLSDEELQEISRKEARSKDLNLEKFDYEKNKAVIDAYNEVAQEEGMNPNLLLAHSRQESGLVPGIKNAEGTSTATGLGQLTVGAYQDVQRNNPEFKDVSFQQLNDPKNIKLQAKAHAKYLKQLINNSGGDEEIALRKYFQGGYSNDYYQKLADKGIDSKGNRLTDEQKQKLRRRGWDGPDADEYVDRVQGYQNMLSDEPISVASRGPASEKIASNPKEEAMKRIRNFLRTGDKSALSAEESPLTFGPSSNPFAYEQGMSSNKRLLDLKKQYDEIMLQKGKLPSGEKINFVPVDGEDGKVPEGMEPKPTAPSSPDVEPEEQITEEATKKQEDTQKPANELAAQQTSLLQQLKDAQEQSRQSRLLGGLGKAAQRMLAGAVGFGSSVAVDPSKDTAYDRMIEDRDRPLKELEQLIKIQSDDPNSDVSNSMRDLLTKDLEKVGMNVNLAGLSYNQMKDIYSPLSSMATRLETAKLKKEEKAETSKKSEEEKLGKWIEKARDDINSKEIGKTDSRLKRLENGISMFEGKGGRTGAKDLAAFYTLMKGIQQDESVIREAEQKMGMDLGGFSSKIKARFAKFFRGELFDEKQRQEMLELMKIQRDQTKNQLSDSLSSFYEDLKNQPMMKDKSEEEVNEVFKRVTPYQFNFSEIEKNKYIKKVADENFDGNVKQATEYLKQKGYIQ